MPIYIERGLYYTSREAAEYLGYTEAYIRRLIGDGDLVALRIGRLSWLITSDEVEHRKKNPPVIGRPKS